MDDAAEQDGFDGFAPEAFAWLAGLEADNSRAFFQAQRPTYDRAVRGALEAMLEELAGESGGMVRMFRQHRDLRFSPDKRPYKTRTYGVIAGRPGSLAGLYAELSAAGLYAGSGYHVLAADQLARFRDAVAADATGPALQEAVAAARAAGLDVFGQALRTAPRGHPRDHPRAELLRHKALGAGRRLPPAAGGGIPPEAALDHVRSTWAACAPLTAWLDEHVGDSVTPPEERLERGATARARR